MVDVWSSEFVMIVDKDDSRTPEDIIKIIGLGA